jgi:hypothetical protein
LSLIQLIGLLLVVGIVLALVPVEATIRKWIVIIVLVVAAFVVLRALGLWPF